uniref:Uncharacterized protein n=1 Tax=Micrurus carvalhoi TaxID=3147026 RepID=A0A2H6MU94_9SAUR
MHDWEKREATERAYGQGWILEHWPKRPVSQKLHFARLLTRHADGRGRGKKSRSIFALTGAKGTELNLLPPFPPVLQEATEASSGITSRTPNEAARNLNFCRLLLAFQVGI